MGNLQFLEAGQGQLPELLELWGVVYNNGVPLPDDRPFLSHTRHWALKRDGNVVGGFGMLETDCILRGATVPCGGIAAVAVAPEARSQGVAAEMMRAAAREYKERGYALGSLYAFRESYYRKFGYEVCGTRLEIDVANQAFPKFRTLLPVTRLNGSAGPGQILDCYKAYASRFNGCTSRQGKLWDRILPPTGNRHIYVAGDPVEAYAVVQHVDEFWTTQKIVEIAYTTRAGFETIFATLFGIGANKSSIKFDEPGDSLYLAIATDKFVTVNTRSQIMFRVLDVEAALSVIPCGDEAEFSFELDDPELPENSGCWRVKRDAGGTEVSAYHGQPDLTFSIQRFTQALMGDPSLEQLATWGFVEVHNPNGLRDAIKMLPRQTSYCMEFF